MRVNLESRVAASARNGGLARLPTTWSTCRSALTLTRTRTRSLTLTRTRTRSLTLTLTLTPTPTLTPTLALALTLTRCELLSDRQLQISRAAGAGGNSADKGELLGCIDLRSAFNVHLVLVPTRC